MHWLSWFGLFPRMVAWNLYSLQTAKDNFGNLSAIRTYTLHTSIIVHFLSCRSLQYSLRNRVKVLWNVKGRPGGAWLYFSQTCICFPPSSIVLPRNRNRIRSWHSVRSWQWRVVYKLKDETFHFRINTMMMKEIVSHDCQSSLRRYPRFCILNTGRISLCEFHLNFIWAHAAARHFWDAENLLKPILQDIEATN